MATWIYERFRVSTVRACRLARLQRASWYYRSRARDQSALRMRIRDIAQARPRFGYQRIHIMLRREGWHVNRKRIHRLYRLDGLQVRMGVRRRKRMSLHRGPVPHAAARNQHWSMDFVHDQLLDGRRFRVLTVIDQWSRESVWLEADFTLTGQSVASALERVSASRSLPKAITVDHGTEFTSKALDEWAWRRGVELAFITPRATYGERPMRVVQRPPTRRMSERQRVRFAGRRQGPDRGMAPRLQRASTAQRTWPPGPK